MVLPTALDKAIEGSGMAEDISNALVVVTGKTKIVTVRTDT